MRAPFPLLETAGRARQAGKGEEGSCGSWGKKGRMNHASLHDDELEEEKKALSYSVFDFCMWGYFFLFFP